MTKAKTKHQRILELLQGNKRRGVDYMELAKITPRYGAVIHTLRADGWDIETKKVKGNDGGARYYLRGGGQRRLRA